MTSDHTKPDPVTDVTGSFVGPLRACVRARNADTEGMRRVNCGRGHQNGGKADQRVERGNKLRHGRHGDAAGDDRLIALVQA